MARGSLALFLALYLLLLAFFIMLMALSSVEGQRAQAVIESLTVTFAGPQGTPDDMTALPLDALDGEARAAEAFIALVTDLFDAALPAVRVRHLVVGRSTEVMMRGDSLFMPGADTLRPAQVAMLDEIVAALSSPPAGMRFEMAVVMQTGTPEAGVPAVDSRDAERPNGAGASGAAEPPGPLPVAPDALTVRRAATLGRVMTARGAAPGSVLVGLAPGDPAWLRLTFRAVDVTRSDPDFRAVPADAVPIDVPDPDPISDPANPSGGPTLPDSTFRAAQPGAAGARISASEMSSPPEASASAAPQPQRTQP